MSGTAPSPLLDAEALYRLASAGAERSACECAALRCPGWESLPAGIEPGLLEQVGTLAGHQGDEVEPTLDEFHPDGTRYWSAEAPISLAHFPYNRAEVWRCRHCRRVFLRYTEYGGYYIDQRIREVDPQRIVGR